MEKGGAKAGKMEVTKISVDQARSYAMEKFAEAGRDLLEESPDFDKNFLLAKTKAMMGRTKRKDMPIVSQQVHILQALLKKGAIDLTNPFSSEEVSQDPFPEGLSGSDAKMFFERGLRIHDGNARDDVVRFKKGKIAVGKLIPIQKQIYFDKAINRQASEPRKKTIAVMTSKSTFVASSDLKIIDGHHRFLSSMLIDPMMKVNVLMIDLPIDKLLPLTVAFSDAIGNKRNA
jgi:hypothetical protein